MARTVKQSWSSKQYKQFLNVVKWTGDLLNPISMEGAASVIFAQTLKFVLVLVGTFGTAIKI